LKIESRGKWHVEIICWNNFKFFDLKMKFMEGLKQLKKEGMGVLVAWRGQISGWYVCFD